jgi:hypothetical protein
MDPDIDASRPALAGLQGAAIGKVPAPSDPTAKASMGAAMPEEDSDAQRLDLIKAGVLEAYYQDSPTHQKFIPFCECPTTLQLAEYAGLACMHNCAAYMFDFVTCDASPNAEPHSL